MLQLHLLAVLYMLRRQARWRTKGTLLQVAFVASVQEHQEPVPLPPRCGRRPQRPNGQLEAQFPRQLSQGDRPELITVRQRADSSASLVLMLQLLLMFPCAAHARSEQAMCWTCWTLTFAWSTIRR